MIGICKLLCTREGIVIDNIFVDKNVFAVWLERLTDVDWSENPIFTLLNPESAVHERIQALLSPKDAQDVPRAIKLLNLAADLRKLDSCDFNPSEASTHRALCLLGEMLDALVEPFINPTFSISQQVISLVKFGHLSCALFLQHESDFMPQHLYSDLQCMVRTAVFRVAHTKILNPDLKVLLCLLGDDVLEVEFGRTRMIGGHSPNGDAETLSHRFGSSRRLNEIFEQYPHLERKPCRLKLKRSRDVDHLSPRHWTGDLQAASCDLTACWTEGVRLAEDVLLRYGCALDFSEHFRDWRTRKIDLLRPKGGKYPGVSAEVDRSLVDPSGISEAANTAIQLEAEYPFRSFNGQAKLEAERQKTLARKPWSIFMDLGNNQSSHKQAVLRVCMDRAGDIDYGKSTDRLLRVRCYSIGGDHADRSKLNIFRNMSRGDIFKLGSLYLSLVCVRPNLVAFAILQCTSLKSASQSLDCAPISEISLANSSYEVSGQILSMIPISHPAANTQLIWMWDSQFVALESNKARKQQAAAQTTTVTRVRHLNVSHNGSIILPLSSAQYSSLNPDDLSSNPLPDSVQKTWFIPDMTMRQITHHLIARLRTPDYLGAQAKMPLYGQVRDGKFPYHIRSPANGQYISLVFGLRLLSNIVM